jgi:hypothetical protein
MALNVFGFSIKRNSTQPEKITSVVSADSQDGAIVTGADGAGYYGYAFNPLGEVKTENDLLRRYREVSAYPEVDQAINEITEEAIVFDDDKFPLELNLEETNIPDTIKKKFKSEFENILNLLEFDIKAYDIFRQYYIDGKLYFNVVFEGTNFKKGIADIRYIDPRKIKKIRNVKKDRSKDGIEISKTVDEYYLYNDKGIDDKTQQGAKLSLDSVVFVTSGLVDQNNGLVLSHLQKAIKPANQLKMVEDALVIYRLTRAPERRIFYIDVGNLPKGKAEQYVQEMMNKFRNKLIYDAATGEIADSKRHLSMMEDLWMPRRNGSNGTEITTLQGGQNLSDIDDVEYFKNKLLNSLNVPISRLKPDQGFSLGRSNEISRDELKFNKFIKRLRTRFSFLFYELLKIQLIAKGIINIEDWDILSKTIRIDYRKDNQFSELKDLEVLNNRLAALQQMDQYIGKYYSIAYVRKHVLRQTEEEIEELEKEIEQEPDPTEGQENG